MAIALKDSVGIDLNDTISSGSGVQVVQSGKGSPQRTMYCTSRYLCVKDRGSSHIWS